MKKIILVIGFMSLIAGAQAQKMLKDSSMSLPAKKNELLGDFRPITFSSSTTFTNGGMMYRRNYNKVSLRFRANGSYSDNGNSVNYTDVLSWYVHSSIGIQKNVPLTKLCQFYWGADLFHEYDYRYTTDPTYINRTKTNIVGISPFAGVKFTFKRRVILGIENSGAFYYSSARRHEGYTDPSIATNIYWTKAFKYNPATNVLVFVGFNF
ncbi:MAG TPA: hypothetical protein VNW06_01520 [Cytophagaceae bacterium]|jgi:hypothetical protein|nr:hypothetical protein [Cytophagaceae bacterium]